MAFNFGKMKPEDKSVQQATMDASIKRLIKHDKLINDKTNPYPAEDWKSVSEICEGNLITAYDKNVEKEIWGKQLKNLIGGYLCDGYNFHYSILDTLKKIELSGFVYANKYNLGYVKKRGQVYLYEIDPAKELFFPLLEPYVNTAIPLFALRDESDGVNKSLKVEEMVLEFLGKYRIDEKKSKELQRVVWKQETDYMKL